MGDDVVDESAERAGHLAHDGLEAGPDGVPLVEDLGHRPIGSCLDVAVDPGLRIGAGVVPPDERPAHAGEVGTHVVHSPGGTRRHDRCGLLGRAVGQERTDAGAACGVFVGVVGCGHAPIIAATPTCAPRLLMVTPPWGAVGALEHGRGGSGTARGDALQVDAATARQATPATDRVFRSDSTIAATSSPRMMDSETYVFIWNQ